MAKYYVYPKARASANILCSYSCEYCGGSNVYGHLPVISDIIECETNSMVDQMLNPNRVQVTIGPGGTVSQQDLEKLRQAAQQSLAQKIASLQASANAGEYNKIWGLRPSGKQYKHPGQCAACGKHQSWSMAETSRPYIAPLKWAAYGLGMGLLAAGVLSVFANMVKTIAIGNNILAPAMLVFALAGLLIGLVYGFVRYKRASQNLQSGRRGKPQFTWPLAQEAQVHISNLK